MKKKVKKTTRTNDNEQEAGNSGHRPAAATASGNGVVVSNRFSGRHGLGKPER